MAKRPVVSREYKIMLRPKLFAGSEATVLATARTFWRELEQSVAGIARRTSGDLASIKCRRLITFLDTADHRLNDGGYIFRERRDAKAGTREVTLKFRHPDRHVAQARDMRPRRAKGARTKFEEDVKTPFVSLYSFSTSAPVGKRWAATVLNDVRKLFPDVRTRLDEFPRDAALTRVSGFTAREIVIEGGGMRLGKRPKVDAECALILWYDSAKRGAPPVAVEFSFRYGNEREAYDGVIAQRAFEIFSRLPRLRRWVDPHPRTKTAFVYG